MKVGYIRVSAYEQKEYLQTQREQLTAHGYKRLFHEIASGAKSKRSQLQAALEYARENDTIVVTRLDRRRRLCYP
ncbi:recombinase family protein [Rothia terrae]|uniref:recombinase family protein n=1 Tax=Rothia terrae TaxID=396015 RepID=UPI0014487036|nr:recombinase family protein [Rothia terrae]